MSEKETAAPSGEAAAPGAAIHQSTGLILSASDETGTDDTDLDLSWAHEIIAQANEAVRPKPVVADEKFMMYVQQSIDKLRRLGDDNAPADINDLRHRFTLDEVTSIMAKGLNAAGSSVAAEWMQIVKHATHHNWLIDRETGEPMRSPTAPEIYERAKYIAERVLDEAENEFYSEYLLRERARRKAKRQVDTEEASKQISNEQDSARVIRGGSILDEPEGVPAIWGGGEYVGWAKGQAMMIASQQGVGKTTIAQQLALHRIGVRNGDFLGYPVDDDEGALVYLAMDRPTQAISSFRRMVTEFDRGQLDDYLIIRKGPLPIDIIADPQALADYVLSLVQPGIDDADPVPITTVVIDSVKDLVGGRSLSSDDVGAGINSAVQELLARGVEVLLLHHQRKAQNGAQRLNTLDDIFGSTLITSGLGSVFALRGEPGGLTADLIHLKQPASGLVEFTLRHDHARGITQREDGPTKAIDIIRQRENEGVTLKQLALALYGSDDQAATKRAGREIKRLGQVIRKTSGTTTPGGKTPDIYHIHQFMYDAMERDGVLPD